MCGMFGGIVAFGIGVVEVGSNAWWKLWKFGGGIDDISMAGRGGAELSLAGMYW